MARTPRHPLLVVALLLVAGRAPAAAPSASRATLPDDEKRWVDDYVAPIVLPEEKKLFLQLTEPYQREVFKKDFWARREREGLAPPLGPGYEKRYAELRELAATKYDGIGSDAGRMVVRRGEPSSITELTECSEVYRQAEVWTYLGPGGSVTRHLFYRPSFGGPRRLWLPGDAGIFQVSSCISSFAQACAVDPRTGSPPKTANCGGGFLSVPKTCSAACAAAATAGEIEARGPVIESAAASTPPVVSTEGLDKLRGQFAAVSTPGAKPLSVSNVVAAGSPQKPTAAAPPASEKAQIAALPEDERKWLEEFVAPIILPQEKKVFLELTEAYQREAFKREFWQRRERAGLPPPLGPGYRGRYEELRAAADEKYDRWPNDAAKVVLRYGEPSSIDTLRECTEAGGTGTFRNLEIWTYEEGMAARKTTHYLFYRNAALAPRRLWTVGTPDSEVFSPGSCRKRFEDLASDCRPRKNETCVSACPVKACDVYKVWEEVSSRQGSASGAAGELAAISTPPRVPLEGLDQFAGRYASNPPAAGAKALTVEGPGPAPTASAAAPGKDTKPSGPAPVRRKLSNKEVKELTAKLEPKYREFLELVDLIITKDEREVFLQIHDSYQKDRFIEAFWKRRSIDAQGLRTDFRRTYTQRVETAKEQFKNLHSDRAKIFIINGAPDAIIPIECEEVYVPIQIWYWERLESLKSKTYLIFYKPLGMGDYKLWVPLDGPYVLQVGGVPGLSGAAMARRIDITRCTEWRTVQQAMSYETAALGSGPMSMLGENKLLQPPTVETEGVDQILSMTTDMAAGAAPLALTRLVRFPEARANKIGVDLSLLIPKSELKSRELGEEHFYNVDVIGEVVKGDRLIDNFKYRFDFPTGEVGADKIPLTVRRYLYPGEYKLVLKVSDGNQNAEGRISENLTVPEQPDPPTPEELAARAQGRGAIEKARETGLVASSVTLLPVAREIVTGLQRFEAKVADGIRAVDFYLNGTKVMTKTRPPFDADLNMGPLPRKQTVRVVGYGENGRAVGEDEYTVNEGKEVFRVRVMSPMKGARVSGPTKVVAAVVVPEGRTLQKMEFYSNETRVATLYQPPFEQVVNIRNPKNLGYVRVVGTLEDGSVAEDLRYVNAPAYVSEVSVDAVELYTTVTEHGRPVAGLQASNFKIYEDGVVQKIESFDYVKNLPLTLGVMIDTSASMLESLPDASQAALGFLDYSIGEKDRAFTVSFDNEPYLLTKMTNRKEKIFRSLAGLRAEGSTALYDAIIYGLYQFTGVKGKKALVLLTDGKDTASKFDFDTLLEYVRKSGISIYAIGLRISGAELDVKYKLNKLAQVTGGQTFYVDSAKNLQSVYRQINEELRSQYLLTYYSTNGGGKDKWRKVEVKVTPANLQGRTLSGYYP